MHRRVGGREGGGKGGKEEAGTDYSAAAASADSQEK